MDTTPNIMTRRSFNKGMLLSLGTILEGCTPLKILLKTYPEAFSTNRTFQEQMLRAFIMTIVPGADSSIPNMTQIYYDTYYPFSTYLPFFLSDLETRTQRLFGARSFLRLSQAEREKVVFDGLHNGDGTAQRLYRGAIYMTRANIYAGIYDDERGCPHIGFYGSSQPFVPQQMFYDNASRYFAPQISLSGNPA